ncbi:hypothetical protein TIFTF001_006295 [Ficus carica]|uniref:Uncharacterized protein n=1 Tax=Ficus carica TaxID=3494 RepID=A0AA88DFJ4_FICCA|nr:hypothetical protein TIFTF001_006295 [Ficus carica]
MAFSFAFALSQSFEEQYIALSLSFHHFPKSSPFSLFTSSSSSAKFICYFAHSWNHGSRSRSRSRKPAKQSEPFRWTTIHGLRRSISQSF